MSHQRSMQKIQYHLPTNLKLCACKFYISTRTFFELPLHLDIVHSIHCTTQTTRYWSVNHSMIVLQRTNWQKTQNCDVLSASCCCSTDVSLLNCWCTWHSLSDSPLQDERGIELKKQCHRDLSAWGKNVMKEHIWLASPIWLIRPSPSAISDFHYKQPQLFNVTRFTIININSLHW
jgi:hypothetical protein